MTVKHNSEIVPQFISIISQFSHDQSFLFVLFRSWHKFKIHVYCFDMKNIMVIGYEQCRQKLCETLYINITLIDMWNIVHLYDKFGSLDLKVNFIIKINSLL